MRRYAHQAIADGHNHVFVRPVSSWEIAIKGALGKLKAPEDLGASPKERGSAHLPLPFFHAEQAGRFPLHHPDPFDRMLLAQAQAEGLILVTHDARVRRYDVSAMVA